MNLKKKILAVTIIPVLVLGMVSIILTVTMVKSSVMEQVEEALKGTASSTLAAYDQNAGDYIVTTSGDIWKGSYNVSKSENLVDRIKENTGMDVTFFYGTKRVMTSALDANGERILGSPAGDGFCPLSDRMHIFRIRCHKAAETFRFRQIHTAA